MMEKSCLLPQISGADKQQFANKQQRLERNSN